MKHWGQRVWPKSSFYQPIALPLSRWSHHGVITAFYTVRFKPYFSNATANTYYFLLPYSRRYSALLQMRTLRGRRISGSQTYRAEQDADAGFSWPERLPLAPGYCPPGGRKGGSRNSEVKTVHVPYCFQCLCLPFDFEKFPICTKVQRIIQVPSIHNPNTTLSRFCSTCFNYHLFFLFRSSH